VHGRYNYKRVSRMVTYFFYKNIAFGLTLFAYNLETRASGQVVYNDWLMSAFNIFFVSLPVLALGCFDQDVNQKSCVQFPHLYKQGQENQCFTTKTQLFWALNATYVSVVTYFFVFYGVHAGEADSKDGHAFGLWEVGTTMYTGIVLTINLQMAQMINYWTWVQHCAIWGSILIWYACNAILSDTDRYWSTYSFQIFTPTVAPTPKYWTATPLIVFVALLPDLIVRASRRLFRPEAHHLVQEYERLDKRLRASGAREDG
jgi:magnesium-transporting ATPase (P-type)